MNLKEIITAVDNNIPVYWSSLAYRVIKNNDNKFFIKCSITGHIRGLTHMDGVTLAEPESSFFKIDGNG